MGAWSCFPHPILVLWASGTLAGRDRLVAESAFPVDLLHSPLRAGWGHSPPSQPPLIGSGNAQCLTPPRHRCSPPCLKASFLSWSGWASCQVPAAPERALPSRSHPHPLDFPAAQSTGLRPSTPASIGWARVALCSHPLPGPPLPLAASGPASPCWPWLWGVCEWLRVAAATLDPAQSGNPSASSGF